MLDELMLRALEAPAYYAVLIVIMQLAGKRLAGQTTTFALIVHDYCRADVKISG